MNSLMLVRQKSVLLATTQKKLDPFTTEYNMFITHQSPIHHQVTSQSNL